VNKTNGVTVNAVFSSSFLDYPDASSHAVVAYMTGCDFNCKNCHNYRFRERVFYDDDVKTYCVSDFIKESKKRLFANRTNKLVLSGGDPLSSHNRDFTKSLLSNKPFCSENNICIYTGNDIESVKLMELPNTFSHLKCGIYREEIGRKPRKVSEKFVLSSPNQGIYDNKYQMLSENGILLFDHK
jgi:hypothetical protein